MSGNPGRDPEPVDPWSDEPAWGEAFVPASGDRNDPWRDVPETGEGEAGSPAGTPRPEAPPPESAAGEAAAAGAAGMGAAGMGAAAAADPATANPATTPAGAGRTCPWCASSVPDGATTCPSCGASVVQREDLGGLNIPGLTSVDPALQDFDKRPLHLRGPSPSQGIAPALIAGAVAGGPIGLAIVGGVAGVAAAEYLGSKRPATGPGSLEDVGKPSEAVLQLLDHIDGTTAREDAAARAQASQGSGSAAGSAGANAAAASDSAAAAEDGSSIWRDLPPVDPAVEALIEDVKGEPQG